MFLQQNAQNIIWLRYTVAVKMMIIKDIMGMWGRELNWKKNSVNMKEIKLYLNNEAETERNMWNNETWQVPTCQ